MTEYRPARAASGVAAQGPLVVFEKVTKRFGSTEALGAVSLSGLAGTVHAVTGENGAGKSTLMNLLAGVHRPDDGEIRLRGETALFEGPAHAQRAGISTIFQELTLLPNLTVAENLFLGKEPRRAGMVDRLAMRRRAVAALERLGSEISVDSYCGDLTVAEQQLVEIAKGVTADADVFIFDEPTAALNSPEVDKLGELLASMKADGKLVFYISHRLDEIFRFCDTVSVLKDGRHVATQPTIELTRDRLISLMVGRTLGELYPLRHAIPAHEAGTPALTISDLRPSEDDPAVSFQVRRGEILGLSGLEGQGQRGFVRALAGLQPDARGQVEKFDPVSGVARPLQMSIVDTAVAGVGFVPEDRKSEGLYLSLSIAQNIALGALRLMPLWRKANVKTSLIDNLTARMRVRAASTSQTVGSLSGGNQQKVMIGRWLASGVDVLLVEEPTRGVDVGAKSEIYGLLREFANGGGAVLIVSSELTEILGLCDRILVVRGGDIVAELAGEATTEEEIMRFALPGTARADAPEAVS